MLDVRSSHICASLGSVTDKHISAAFILYRQHYQAAVVAQNPGLANPEISKVIGEQWRDSSIEVKNHWKSLADVCYPSLEALPSVFVRS